MSPPRSTCMSIFSMGTWWLKFWKFHNQNHCYIYTTFLFIEFYCYLGYYNVYHCPQFIGQGQISIQCAQPESVEKLTLLIHNMAIKLCWNNKRDSGKSKNKSKRTWRYKYEFKLFIHFEGFCSLKNPSIVRSFLRWSVKAFLFQ